jgi:hypothetical protein
LDLIVKWAEADTVVNDHNEIGAAFSERATIHKAMHGLANEIEARRLAEGIDAPIEDRHHVPAYLDLP